MKKTIALATLALISFTGCRSKGHRTEKDAAPALVSASVIAVPKDGCATVPAAQVSRSGLGIRLEVPETADGSPLYFAAIAPSERVRTRTNVTLELRDEGGNVLSPGRSFCKETETRDADCEPMVGATLPSRAQRVMLVVHGRDKAGGSTDIEVCGSENDAPPRLLAAMAVWPEESESIFPEVELSLGAGR